MCVLLVLLSRVVCSKRLSKHGGRTICVCVPGYGMVWCARVCVCVYVCVHGPGARVAGGGHVAPAQGVAARCLRTVPFRAVPCDVIDHCAMPLII